MQAGDVTLPIRVQITCTVSHHMHPYITLTRTLTCVISDVMQAGDVTLPIRVLHLPMAFNERWTHGAIQKYMRSVRSEGPYLPSNVEFVAANNGLTGQCWQVWCATHTHCPLSSNHMSTIQCSFPQTGQQLFAGMWQTEHRLCWMLRQAVQKMYEASWWKQPTWCWAWGMCIWEPPVPSLLTPGDATPMHCNINACMYTVWGFICSQHRPSFDCRLDL